MNDFKYVWILIVVSIIGGFLTIFNADNQKTARYDKCIEAMTAAIPDANDDSRALFLKNCEQ